MRSRGRGRADEGEEMVLRKVDKEKENRRGEREGEERTERKERKLGEGGFTQ